MCEKVDKKTPEIIKELFAYPYKWFSDIYGAKDLTVLDVGCGNLTNVGVLELCFKKAFYVDKDVPFQKWEGGEAIKWWIPKTFQCVKSVLKLPFEDNSIDVVFCFEVIEHLEEHEELLRELLRITKDVCIIGSINEDGPDNIDGVEIYKGNKNSYHVKELGVSSFYKLFEDYIISGLKITYFHSTLYSKFHQTFTMNVSLCLKGLCNYVVLDKREAVNG